MQPECPNTIRNGGRADSRNAADFRHDAVDRRTATRCKSSADAAVLASRGRPGSLGTAADRQVASLASLLQFLWRRIGNHYGHLRELAVFGFHRD